MVSKADHPQHLEQAGILESRGIMETNRSQECFGGGTPVKRDFFTAAGGPMRITLRSFGFAAGAPRP